MGWHRRLWNIACGRNLTDEIDEELQFHIDAAIRANIATGMSPAEARRDALRRFGSAAAMRDRTRDTDVFVLLDDVRQDVAFAIRSLRKRPGFTCAALLTLALGIGATTAMFTVVRSVLLRPLPFPAADTLYAVSYTWQGPAWLYPGMSDARYLEFREATHAFESLATFGRAQSTLTGAGDAARLNGALVTTNFFAVLGVTAAAGRTFGPEDDGPGTERVVLVSDGLWRGRFGANPSLVNKTITLDGERHRVVGILPPGFSYPADSAYWRPLTVRIEPDVGYLRPVIGRVRTGVTREQAQADLETWVRSLPPDPNQHHTLLAHVRPLHQAIVGDLRLPLLIFSGAVGFVLLIVCANVANLLLMRAVSRRQEIATRLALGASRGRLVRQLLTESALLSIAGGSAGAAIAMLMGPALLSTVPEGRLPQDLVVRPDGWVLLFAGGLSLFTGLIVGLAPIVQTATNMHYSTLREGTASPTRRSYRLRHGLIVAQVALTLMLLVGAGLLLKSFTSLLAVPLGFTPERVLTMTVDLPQTRYPAPGDAVMFHDRLLAAVAALPGVVSAGAVNWIPLGDMRIGGDVYAKDRPDLSGKYRATKAAVSPDYFTTIGIRLLRGRPFTAHDRRGSEPVLIISESVARRFWPDGDPVGQHVSLMDNPQPGDWLTVVGVVEDVRQEGFRADPAHAVYQPYAQVTKRSWVGYMTFLVRTNAAPPGIAPLMRVALTEVDKDEAPQSLATLESVIDRTVAEPKFQARLLAIFSIAALLLAALGIYGVLASSVLERRFEIGVRMALGADGSAIIGMVLRRTMMLVGAGVVVGLAGAYGLSSVLDSLLFNISSTDGPTFILATVVLVAAAIAATLLPARRASSIDPLVALRTE